MMAILLSFLVNIHLDLSSFCNITGAHLIVKICQSLLEVCLDFFVKILAILNCKFLRREVWTVRLIKKLSYTLLTKVTLVLSKVIKASVRRY